MANVLEYLKWRGDVSMSGSLFNEVDNLLLSQIVYLDFDGIIPKREEGTGIQLIDAAKKYVQKHPNPDDGSIPPQFRHCLTMLLAMADSDRFKHCILSAYDHEVSKEISMQFGAMRILLDDGSTFVSFSGTDDSMTGWKENFIMSFAPETQGQMRALSYLKQTVDDCTGPIRVGGHSKGGNLAVFASMHLPSEDQSRLIDIYNNDGPGFSDEMITKTGYREICSRVHTFMPQSSIVGILLEHQEEYHVIRSSNIGGFWQHAAMSWEVMGTQFVRHESLTGESVFVSNATKAWLQKTTPEKRRQFTDILFMILDAAEIDETEDFRKLNLKRILEMMKTVETLGPDDKAALKEVVKAIGESVLVAEEKNRTMSRIADNMKHLLRGMQKKEENAQIPDPETESGTVQKRTD